MAEFCWRNIRVGDGNVVVVARSDRLCRIFYLAAETRPAAVVQDQYPDAETRSTPVIARALQQIEEYFSGRRIHFDLPLDLEHLSPFQQRVLRHLARVPYGSTVTYAELAAASGSPRAFRAVGRVMATNPFPIVLPCHRVVRADGRMGDYSAAYGRLSKQRLIDLERRQDRPAPDLQ